MKMNTHASADSTAALFSYPLMIPASDDVTVSPPSTPAVGPAICSICHLPDGLVDTECAHSFHINCLLRWNYTQARRGRSSTCPMCRHQLVPMTENAPETHVSPPPASLANRAIDELVGLMSNQEEETREAPLDRLINTICSGNLTSATLSLLSSPYLVNSAHGPERLTPVLYAISRNDDPMTSMLLRYGGSPRLAAAHGLTPLHLAAVTGNLTICMKLIDYGACVDMPDGSGETPVFIAVRRKDGALVNSLLRKGADVNVVNGKGEALLHVCAQGTSIGVLHSILRTNPILDVKNYLGDSPLYTAITYGNVDFVRSMVSRVPYSARMQANILGCTPNMASLSCSPRMRSVLQSWHEPRVRRSVYSFSVRPLSPS